MGRQCKNNSNVLPNQKILESSDVVVSTAIHEFFGIAIAEAAAAGAIPIVPRRLAYPEIFEGNSPKSDFFFYDGSVSQLTEKLKAASAMLSTTPGNEDENSGHSLDELRQRSTALARRFAWPTTAAAMDEEIFQLTE